MRNFSLVVVLLVIASCSGPTETPESPDEQGSAKTGITAPQNINWNIISIYPHDTSAYTQGLEYHNGKLFEGTGDYELSSLRITDIKTGNVEKKHLMGSAQIFGEGITIFKGKIYQLTWENHLVNVYDSNNIDKVIKTFQWPNQGWGITNNGTDLIISDGSSNLYFVNADDFRIKRTIQVVDNLGEVDQLNELEYIDGYIFANVYQTDFIVKIDPSNGHVAGNLSLPGLLQQYARNQIIPDRTNVLNGIAWDSTTRKLYITGKRWPKLFEMTIN